MIIEYQLHDEEEPRQEEASVVLRELRDDVHEFRDHLEDNGSHSSDLAMKVAVRAAALLEAGVVLVGYRPAPGPKEE